MQCTPPPPNASVAPDTPTTSRDPAVRRTASSARSASGPSTTGTIDGAVRLVEVRRRHDHTFTRDHGVGQHVDLDHVETGSVQHRRRSAATGRSSDWRDRWWSELRPCRAPRTRRRCRRARPCRGLRPVRRAATPRARRRATCGARARCRTRVMVGLRFGLSSVSSVVMRVPAPSTVTAPPSSTNGAAS